MLLFVMTGIHDEEGEYEEDDHEQNNDTWLILPYLFDSADDLRPVHTRKSTPTGRKAKLRKDPVKIKMRLHSEPR